MQNALRLFLSLFQESRRRLTGVALAFVALAALNAQTITTGGIVGVVKDSTGAVVPSATVTLKNLDNGQTRTVTANSKGEYGFNILPVGNYQISATSPGLRSDFGNVRNELGQVITVDLTLKPEQSTTIVQVTESVPLVQSDNANLATTFNNTQIKQLPAPGNDITAYAFTTPGATLSTGGGYGNFSIFGLPAVSNLFTVNGTDIMDPYFNLNNSGASNLTLGSNELSETAVVVNGYTGQYGRQAGANVNYVTKSGTNRFHGNGVWYYNGRYLNANDWFNNASATPRPFSISNAWADSIGGPILKNKLFFFVDNEGIRYVLPAGGPVFIPTTDFASFVQSHLAMTNAAAVPFYNQAFNLYGNASGASRATPANPVASCGDILTNGVPQKGPNGATIPADPGAAAALAAGFGTTRTCARTFQNTVNGLNTEWLLAVRGDYNITSNDRIYLRYNTDHGVQPAYLDPITPLFNAQSNQPQYGGQFGYTRIISASMVNQFLLSGSYYSALFSTNLAAALNAFPTTWAFTDGLYNSNTQGTSLSENNRFPQGRKIRQGQLVDDFSWTFGVHTIKAGANVRKNWVSTYAYGLNTSGTMTFNSMTDFLDGALAFGSTYAQNFSNIGAESVNFYSAGFYGQDEWRIRPNLTLTLALRLDRNSNIQCPAHCFNELRNQPFGQVNHNVTVPYNAVIQPGLSEAFPSIEPIVAAPRVGFAWSPTNDMVIRGGFGIFTDLYQAILADRLITNAPAVTSFTTNNGLVALNNPNSAFAVVANSNSAFQNGFANGQTLAQMTAAGLLSVPNYNTVNHQLYNSKYYQWNFEAQKSFLTNYMVSLNFVGNRGSQENNQYLFPNQYSALGFQGLPTSAPDARFGQIREFGNQSFSNYLGFVTAFKVRMTSNLTGNFSYTWSHAQDTCSNECLQPFNLLTAISLRYQTSPFGQRALNYASSDYDIRNSLNANYVYTVPSSYFQNSILKHIFSNWTVAGTFYWHTGYPFSVVNSAVRSAGGVKNAVGIANQQFMAQYFGLPFNATCSTPNVQCFSASMFASAATQRTFGNVARNAFRGPEYFDTDFNLNKTIPILEHYQLLIGANFFNILNHPNFDLPVNNLALGNFGMINSTVSAPTSAYGSFQGSAVSGRVIQTQIRFTF